MIFLQIIILIMLAFICYQDLHYRAVYWICFPILATSLLIIKFNLTGPNQVLKDAGFGLLFLLLQLFILWCYFSIKNRKPLNITNDHLGWGDVLFLMSIVFYLSPANYILFYVASLILVLLYVIIANLLTGKINKQIPLAGLQAALLGIILLLNACFTTIKLYDDTWIYLLIGNYSFLF